MQHTETLTRTGTSSQPEKQVKWRNLVFSNDGKTIYGKKLYPTENEARAAHQRQIERVFSNGARLQNDGIGTIINAANYGWCMQLPVMQ